MADHWLKTLGTNLFDTGAAYLQQVRLVQELKALPEDQARKRFTEYVSGLSAAARAGFAITLTSLASKERQADVRRFLETLRAALANPAAWSSGDTAPAPKNLSQTPTAPAERAAPTLDNDLARLDEWLALDDQARPLAIETYVMCLSDMQLASFKAHMEEARENVAQRIADHRENEARIAAGRFVEDQMSYRMQRLAGAPPDPDWLAALQNFARIKTFIEAVHHYLQTVQEERRKPSPPPPPAPLQVRKPKADEPAKSADSGKSAGMSPQIQVMREMLEAELESGRIGADRAPAYRRVLDKIESVAEAHALGEIGPDVAGAQLQQQLIPDFMRYLADPGTASTQATPRGREVLRYTGALKTALIREYTTPPPPATDKALAAIAGDLTAAQTAAAAARDGATLAEIESELLRPAAHAWHELALTRHAVLARPLWECNEVMPTVNTVFYSGAADLQRKLEGVAEGKRLEVAATRRLKNHGQQRWDLLNACHVAVFDLRRAQEITKLATSAPKRARELADTAYELGLAFALGKPVVILTGPGESLPFDIDLSQVFIDGTDDDEETLAQALDEAFYVAQREGRGNAIPASLAELDRLTREHPRRASIEGMRWLDPALKDNPAGFAAAVHQVLRELAQPGWQLLRPAWPGSYPDAARRRCFHVMPFGPPWADESRDTARAACKELGLSYRRGDEAEEGRIVHAIWDDLCRAGVVLVELAGGNLNVLIELGIAHALGRRVLAVQRDGEQDLRPRHIEKLRVHRYGTAEALSAVLIQHLKP